MPAALTHLTLEHEEGLWHHEMGDELHTSDNAQDYIEAFVQQRHSLKFLRLNDDLYDAMEEGILDFRDFPELERLQCPEPCVEVDVESGAAESDEQPDVQVLVGEHTKVCRPF